MAAKVIDASAAAALIFDEPEAPSVVERIGGASLIAPDLLAYELGNVCLTKSRRHPERRDSLASAYELRRRFAVDEMWVDLNAVVKLALATNLTIYDASYLWLAEDVGAELVTLDRKLEAAARARTR